MGDGAYVDCAGVITRYLQEDGMALWPWQVFWNRYLNHYRQRVEHTMHLIKDHGIWRAHKARNSLPVIQAAMKLLDGESGPRCRYPGHHHGPHDA